MPPSTAAFKDLSDADLESLCTNVMLPVYTPCEPLGDVECRRALRALRGRPKDCTVALFEAWMNEASTLECARRWDGTSMGMAPATATFSAFATACSLPPGGVNPPDVAPTGACDAKCPVPKANFNWDYGTCTWPQPYQTRHSCAVSNVLEFGKPSYDPPTVKNGTTTTVTMTVPLAKGWFEPATPTLFDIEGAASKTYQGVKHILVGNGAEPLVIKADVVCKSTGPFGLVLGLGYDSTIDQCAVACLNDKGAECVP